MAPTAQDATGRASGRRGRKRAAVSQWPHADAGAVTIRRMVGGVLIPAALVRASGAQAAPCVSNRAGSVPAAYAAIVARERTLVCERLATHIPGVQVAVAVNGRLVWSEGFGYADAERQRPVTRETQFRIGSVSKPLTATAVALLYEQRKLDLDAAVQRYVPSFPDKGYPVTTRQLAGHLAGIRSEERRVGKECRSRWSPYH